MAFFVFVLCLTLTANPSWAIQKRLRDDHQHRHTNEAKTQSWALQGKSMHDTSDGSAHIAKPYIVKSTPSGHANEGSVAANYTPQGNEMNSEAAQPDEVVYDDGFTHAFPDRSDSEDDGQVQFQHFEESDLTIWGSKWKSNGRYPRIGIGINCPKCGSSFFQQVIGQHPQVMTGVRKETKYFSADQSLNVCPNLKQGSKAATQMETYVSRCFGENPNGEQQDPWKNMNKATLFEFTPDYLFHAVENNAKVRQPIASVYGDADVRFIVLLHDPVLRVISELNMWRESQAVWKGKTDAQMSAAVPGFLKEGKEIIRMGHYAENLEAFRTSFAKDSILIVNRHGLDEEKTWQHVFSFFGLEAYIGAGDTTIKKMLKNAYKHEDSVTHSKKGYLQLSQEATKLLKNHYAEHDKKLWKLLELQKKPWW